MIKTVPAILNLCLLMIICGGPAYAKEVATGEIYTVIEISFRGPQQTPRDMPARDIDFWAKIRHESGAPEYKIHGFWDGDGQGGTTGDVFKIRFTPTKAGRWNIVEVHSNAPKLAKQHLNDHINAKASKAHRGFWLVDPQSAGNRWYQRTDGSHAYIVGNTQYSFLSGVKEGGVPTGVDIPTDIAQNAEYFNKLRFSIVGDRYPHPKDKPFFDDEGNLTAAGDFSHRPNPNWFHKRVDLAVASALKHDLIADLILAGPDTLEARSTLRAEENSGDPTPYLKYVAARYGSYPNVWICISNEYNYRSLPYTVDKIASFGRTLRGFLPYAETPLSAHPWSAVLWEFDNTGNWYDHIIIQKKRKTIPETFGFIDRVWRNEGGSPRNKPIFNDELSYQGDGDKHTEEDSIEAVLGTFLGGGYASVGYKSGNKLGHYFWGAFTPKEHTSAISLKWLRQTIDENITFWKMEPGSKIFSNLETGFRAMSWADQEYVLGTNKAHEGVVAELPAGEWSITQFDLTARQNKVLNNSASGKFVFNAPASRAVLYVFKKNSKANKST